MSKRHDQHDYSESRQGNLFDTQLSEGALDISLGFRQSLSRSMHDSGMDRYHIAAEVSRLMHPREISRDMLDKCCGSDLAYGLRAEALPAICHVIRTVEPVRVLMEPINWGLLSPEDRDLVRLARLMEQRHTIEDEIMQLRAKRGFK